MPLLQILKKLWSFIIQVTKLLKQTLVPDRMRLDKSVKSVPVSYPKTILSLRIQLIQIILVYNILLYSLGLSNESQG